MKIHPAFYILKKMEEIWKDIKDFEGYYQISNLGRVKSLERYVFCRSKVNPNKINECIRKLRPDKDGYLTVSLKMNQATKIKKIHRLVAEAFIENTQNKEEVNHKNGVKTDNRIENLEWNTTKENSRHRTKTKLTKPILSDEQIEYIRKNAIIVNNGKANENSISDLARRFDVDWRTVYDVYKGRKLYL